MPGRRSFQDPGARRRDDLRLGLDRLHEVSVRIVDQHLDVGRIEVG